MHITATTLTSMIDSIITSEKMIRGCSVNESRIIHLDESEMRKVQKTQSLSGNSSAYVDFILRHVAPDPRRFLIREADMEKVSRKCTSSWHFWLFNDYLICGSILDNGDYQLERMLSLLTCSIFPFQSSVFPNAIQLSEGGKAFVISTSSKNEQMEWLGLIMNASASLRCSPTYMIESVEQKSTLHSSVSGPIRRNSWGIDVCDGVVRSSLIGQEIVDDTLISCALCDQVVDHKFV